MYIAVCVLGMVPISVFLPYLPIAVHRRRDASRKQLKTIFDRVIHQRRTTGVRESDFLQHLIDSRSIINTHSLMCDKWMCALVIFASMVVVL